MFHLSTYHSKVRAARPGDGINVTAFGSLQPVFLELTLGPYVVILTLEVRQTEHVDLSITP